MEKQLHKKGKKNCRRLNNEIRRTKDKAQETGIKNRAKN